MLRRLFVLLAGLLLVSCSFPGRSPNQQEMMTQTPTEVVIPTTTPTPIIPAPAVTPTAEPTMSMFMPMTGGNVDPTLMPTLIGQGILDLEMSDDNEMGPHMQMAPRPAATESDRQRAESVAEQAYQANTRYLDYLAAIQDGYSILAPEVPQKVYHFINYSLFESRLENFDPAQPSALLYTKTGEGYRWVGVMYSAPISANLDELNRRYPSSMSQWHAHVNICVPPGRPNLSVIAHDSRFGLEGSISTRSECEAAGGKFLTDLGGWMVHVYLFTNH